MARGSKLCVCGMFGESGCALPHWFASSLSVGNCDGEFCMLGNSGCCPNNPSSCGDCENGENGEGIILVSVWVTMRIVRKKFLKQNPNWYATLTAGEPYHPLLSTCQPCSTIRICNGTHTHYFRGKGMCLCAFVLLFPHVHS